MHIPHKFLISALVLYIPVAEATGGNFKLTPIIGASIFGIAAIGAFVFYFFSKKNQPLIKVESEPSHTSTNVSRGVPESITPQPQPHQQQPQQQQQQQQQQQKQKQSEEEEQNRLRIAEEKLLKEQKALEERRRKEEEEEREEKRLQEEKARQLLVNKIRRQKEEKEQKRLEELKRKEELAREEEERKKELELEKERQLERQKQEQKQEQEKELEKEKEKEKEKEEEKENQVEKVSEPVETRSKYESPNRLKKKAGSHINFTSGTTSSPLGRRSPSFSDIPRPDLDKLAQEDFSENSEPEQRDRERSFSESASAPPKISFDAQPKNVFFPTTPSQCSVCRGSIFGKPIETSSGTKFHPRCFTCAKCQKKITGKYFPYEHPPTAPVPQVEWFLCEYCSNSLKQSRPAFKKAGSSIQ